MKNRVKTETTDILKKRGLLYDEDSAHFYYAFDKSTSAAYQYEEEGIWILEEKNRSIEFSKAADTKNILALTEPVIKPYVVHLKEIDL